MQNELKRQEKIIRILQLIKEDCQNQDQVKPS